MVMLYMYICYRCGEIQLKKTVMADETKLSHTLCILLHSAYECTAANTLIHRVAVT